MAFTKVLYIFSLAVYMCVAMGIGVSFLFGLNRGRGRKVPQIMIVTGAYMMLDTLAVVVTIIGEIFMPESNVYLLAHSVLEGLVSAGFIVIGFTLLYRGYPPMSTLSIVYGVLLSEMLICMVLDTSYLVGATIFVILQFGFVLYLGHRSWRHDKDLPLMYSSVEGHQTSWFLIFAGWSVLVSPAFLFSYITEGVLHDGLGIAGCAFTILVYTFLYQNVKGMSERRVDSIAYGDSMILNDMNLPAKKFPTAKRPIFEDDELGYYREKLLAMMEEEQLYLDADLSVEDIAKKLGTNTSYFYYFMRDVMHMRFFEFVNGYRIDKAKKLLLEGKTVEQTAQECGFNSANSMNRVFKNFTSQTPAHWRSLQITKDPESAQKE